MDIKALEYLWKIISLCWLSHNFEKARELASTIYDLLLDFPLAIEELVVEFSEGGNRSAIDRLAFLLAKNRSYAAEQHVTLVGLLVRKELITINEAAELLANLDTLQLESKIAERILRVKDVAWLVNEDVKDGVMEAGNDSLLKEALESVVNAGNG